MKKHVFTSTVLAFAVAIAFCGGVAYPAQGIADVSFDRSHYESVDDIGLVPEVSLLWTDNADERYAFLLVEQKAYRIGTTLSFDSEVSMDVVNRVFASLETCVQTHFDNSFRCCFSRPSMNGIHCTIYDLDCRADTPERAETFQDALEQLADATNTTLGFNAYWQDESYLPLAYPTEAVIDGASVPIFAEYCRNDPEDGYSHPFALAPELNDSVDTMVENIRSYLETYEMPWQVMTSSFPDSDTVGVYVLPLETDAQPTAKDTLDVWRRLFEAFGYSPDGFGVLEVPLQPVGSAAQIRAQMQAIIVPEEEAAYIPIRPAADDYVNFFKWSTFEGIAIHCADGAALDGATLGDYTFTFQQQDGRPASDILLEHYADKLRTLQTHEAYDTSAYTVDITVPAQYEDCKDEIYLLYHADAQGESYPDDLLNALLTDTRFTVIGVMQTVWQMKAFYDAETPRFVLTAAEGCTLDADALATDAYGKLTYEAETGAWVSGTTGMTQADATTLCANLEARDDIAFAWMRGIYPVSEELYTTAGASILPLTSTTADGDTNENGKLEATDAQLALQAYVAVQLANLPSPLTATQIAHADMDGDGAVSLQDAMEILQRYVATLVA